MRKKSTHRLLMLLCISLAFVAAACGTNTSSTNTTLPTGEKLYVLDGYSAQNSFPTYPNNTSQHFVALHPGATATTALPTGLTSIDHLRLYTAVPLNGETLISVINTQTGETIRSFSVHGSYATAAYGYDNAVVSATGQWLALRHYTPVNDTTTVVLINTQAGKLLKTISLSGNYTLDALSPGGKALYLLEKLHDAPGHYYVRVYDVDGNSLIETPIVDKTASTAGDPNMSGLALARQELTNGTQAYTLYIDAIHNIAFIHVLPLNDQIQPTIARCIDLPAGKTVEQLRYYTLALSADGTTLYAANAALGVVTRIQLNTSDPLSIYSDLVSSTKHFDGGDASLSSSDKTRMLYNGATLSSDQQTMYVTGIHGIWAISTADLSVRGHYLTHQAFTSVGLSSDGKTLYAVDPTSGITLLDAASGQALQVVQGSIHAPWGIAWIAN